MNGIIFATHDKIAFLIFSLLLVTFAYGFYLRVKAFFKFVFMIQASTRIENIRTVYLVTAPFIATLIVSEVFTVF
tara:strand:- start:608 stop:832 length:225 start_codon:yes stop_codon:yes gene_type:complete